jgi:hypothetical protein
MAAIVKRTKIEMRRSEKIKRIRNRIRLEHSIAADYELNDVLSDEIEKFDREVSAGRLPK